MQLMMVKPRFQIRVSWFQQCSNSNNPWDGWEYNQSGVNLTITYTQ